MKLKEIFRKLPFYNSLWFLKIRDCLFIVKEKNFNYPFMHYMFKEKLGYSLNLKHPKSFNEKLNHKKINDRNNLLTITADKLIVRDYVVEKLGDRGKQILIPLIFHTDKPENIPFDSFNEKYIIKANHGSGTNILVRNPKNIDKKQIISLCKDWLLKDYGHRNFEWGYKNIKKRIVIEKLLEDNNGNVPVDYKFYLFNGNCKLIHVDFDRYGKLRSRSLFNTDWDLLDVQYEYPKGELIERPNNLDEMIRIAQQLSSNLDFARIDLYSHMDKIYFGEITHYPGNGMEKFTPQSFDFEFGKNWILNK